MPIHILTTDWSRHAALLSDIRRRVFIIEQSVPEELEWDNVDAQAIHFLAEAVQAGQTEQQAIGCARLLLQGELGKIGRMAVLKAHRRQGIGRQLLQACIKHAEARGLQQLVLDAQVSALGFYQQAGFLAEGDSFLDAGIVHQRMCKPLRINQPKG